MSYGMHDYLAEKAMQNQYMQKRAAEEKPLTPEEYAQWYDANKAAEQSVQAIEEEGKQEVYGRHGGVINDEVGKPTLSDKLWGKYNDAKNKVNEYYSRSRAFLASHPEILYGLGGAGIGAGIGALVAPKRRLLGSLIGLGLGGAISAGGKLAYDRYLPGAGYKTNINDAVKVTGARIRDDYNRLTRNGNPISRGAEDEQ